LIQQHQKTKYGIIGEVLVLALKHWKYTYDSKDLFKSTEEKGCKINKLPLLCYNSKKAF